MTPAASEIRIRPPAVSDAPALAALGRRTFIETFVAEDGFAIPYPETDLEPFLEAGFGIEGTIKRLAEPGAAWWVADRDGELLAYANVGPNGLPHPEAQAGDVELRKLYVSRDAQGLGLGTRLLGEALAWMAANTRGAQWIGVWSGNAKAQKLYGAHGFEKVGEYDYPVGAWKDHEFILRRR